MDSFSEIVEAASHFTISDVPASRLLSLPQELLDRIAQHVVVQAQHLEIYSAKEERTVDTWYLWARQRGLINLAMTCRLLYVTTIRQLYSKNNFIFFPTDYKFSRPAFEPFVRQIGHTNANQITSIIFAGHLPTEELGHLNQLPRLRKLDIIWSTILHSSIGHVDNQESRFWHSLRGLSLDDVPSLRSLRIMAGQYVSFESRLIEFQGNWIEIESAVDTVRRSLQRRDAHVAIRLYEVIMLNKKGNRLIKESSDVETLKREYVSPGVYMRTN